MDPRVIAHFDGDVSLANISPRKRDRVLARHRVVAADTTSAGDVVAVAVSTSLLPGQIARCPGCGYVYDEARGDVHEGFPPGTPWSGIPVSWTCPDCGVRDKSDFEVVGTVEA